MHTWLAAAVVVVTLVNLGTASANVLSMTPSVTSLEMVPVRDAGNTADTRYATPGYGAVAYDYQIGKYEVTAGQYAEFLNKVAGVDAYRLYNVSMWTIQRSGSGTQADPYTYTAVLDRINQPVNFVCWGDAARFCNWLTNGQPAGRLTGDPSQDAWLTEDGSYCLNGGVSGSSLAAVGRKTNARFVVPTEDEWYKAAYFKGGTTDAGYWVYPTASDTITTDMASHISRPVADVGSYPYPSPYGTFDQGGNMWEWNDTLISGWAYGVRGGSFGETPWHLEASSRHCDAPDVERADRGFRVALVPEPATLSLLALGGLLIARRRRG